MLAFLLAVSAAASPVPPPAVPGLQVTELRPGVWVHTSWQPLADGTPFPSNGLVIRDGQTAVVIDTAWGEEPTAELLDWIARVPKLKVARVIPTHGHADRVGGAPVLAERAIPLDRLTDLALGEARQVGPVEVFHPGAAHTHDNVVVWLPAQRILFGGCAVKSASAIGLGNVADADVAAWPAAIRRMQARYPEAEVVVPGHGEPGGRALLDHTLVLAVAGKP